jgi:soluble lytic murein transglycosylase-like protein
LQALADHSAATEQALALGLVVGGHPDHQAQRLSGGTGSVMVSRMPRVLVFALMAAMALRLADHAGAEAVRLTDSEGVTHFTNTPADPRYRPIRGLSGTQAGLLRLPPTAVAPFRSEIRDISLRHGVSASLVEAVIRVESGFNPAAVSPRGAQGLMQLMPATAAGLGVPDSFDPRTNIEGGVRHLRALIDRFPQRVDLAVAAYNAGEGAVTHYAGIPPYPETQHYVRKVLELSGADRAAADASRVVYRLEDKDGTITFTNVPPARPRR